MQAGEEHNLMSDYELPKDIQTEPEDNTYYPHLKREIYLNLLYDDDIYDSSLQKVDWRIAPYLPYDMSVGSYSPVLNPSDFW